MGSMQWPRRRHNDEGDQAIWRLRAEAHRHEDAARDADRINDVGRRTSQD